MVADIVKYEIGKCFSRPHSPSDDRLNGIMYWATSVFGVTSVARQCHLSTITTVSVRVRVLFCSDHDLKFDPL